MTDSLLVLSNDEALARADRIILEQANPKSTSFRYAIAKELQDAHAEGFTRCLSRLDEIHQHYRDLQS